VTNGGRARRFTRWKMNRSSIWGPQSHGGGCPGHSRVDYVNGCELPYALHGRRLQLQPPFGGGPRGSQRFTSVEKALFYLKRLQSLHPHTTGISMATTISPTGEPWAKTCCGCDHRLRADCGRDRQRRGPARAHTRLSCAACGNHRRTNVSFFPDGIHEATARKICRDRFLINQSDSGSRWLKSVFAEFSDCFSFRLFHIK